MTTFTAILAAALIDMRAVPAVSPSLCFSMNDLHRATHVVHVTCWTRKAALSIWCLISISLGRTGHASADAIVDCVRSRRADR